MSLLYNGSMFKTQYTEVDMLISELCETLKAALGSNLKGLYLFGSLIGGDFDEQKSDIDLLAIVENVISESELQKLKEAHELFVTNHPHWDNRVEVTYVSVAGMKHFKSMPNKIARISPGEDLHYREMDIDWLMDWHMVQVQGQTILGPPPETYIPHITKEEYVQSIRKILLQHEASANQARHKGYQSYIVMSFCRNLYVIKHGKQVSKIAGARWASKRYPDWANFINEATEWRGLADKSDSPETQKQTIKFTKFAMKESRRL